MPAPPSTLTDLILETFRLNGELLTAGDDLVADLNLTSARWQVLGAVAFSPAALPVAHVARNMGLSRQSVQRLVNEMAGANLLRLAPNPHHKRARLVVMTAEGRAAFSAAMDRQRPWADSLAAGLAAKDISTACRILATLRNRLQSQNDLQPKARAHVEKHA